MAWHDLSERGRDQYGQVHVSDADRAQMTPRALRRAAARLECTRPHRGVVTLPGAQDVPEARISAALLTVQPPVLASHWTAAWLFGLVRALPTTIDVLVPHGRRARVRDHVQVHRTRIWHGDHAHEIRGLAVTAAARTLGDLAAQLEIERLRAWAIDMVQREQTTWEEITVVGRELGRATGAGKLRRVAEETAGEDPESILDYALRRKLRAAKLHPDAGALQVPFAGRAQRIDIPWARYKVGIEADSLTYHGDRASLQRDIRRHNANRHSDWIVLRAGWAEVDSAGAWVEFLTVLQSALRARGARI